MDPQSLLPESLKQLQATINQSTSQVGLRDLQVISKEDTAKLAAGAESKTKTYRWARGVRFASLCVYFSLSPIKEQVQLSLLWKKYGKITFLV